MNFPAVWFAPSAQWAAAFVWLAMLGMVAPRAWPALKRHSRLAGIAMLALALCWSLRAAPLAGQMGGLVYHLLGVSLLTLMLGGSAALWLASLVMLLYTLIWQGWSGLPATGIAALSTLVPPVLVTTAARSFSRRLPRNVFVYIFINGFLAAAAGIFLAAVAVGTLLYAAGVFDADTLLESVLPVFFFIAWGEAFLTGLLSAIFIALAPQLLTTFADREYLQHSPPEIWKQ